ncbi:hypothetical protein GN958_ATG04624 [Phytophthora infestans]|uniref:Uncharacterized protein n=1 Tax=Phytophthora infestans TaxID=4787 RepID=A0A8S9V4M5_PHYIN|nr:hypothetical protein GN958_ATG04624 [Phytophthora infestans]
MPPKRANEPSRPRWRKRQRAHRSGAQTQQDRGAQLAARIDFNGVWKELKAAEWTPKVSRGLDKGTVTFCQVETRTESKELISFS